MAHPCKTLKSGFRSIAQYWNGLLAAYGRECTDDMPVLIEPFDYIGEVI